MVILMMMVMLMKTMTMTMLTTGWMMGQVGARENITLRPTSLNFAPLGSYNALEQKYRDIEIRRCYYLKYKFQNLIGQFKQKVF